jgi:hypothetical protein
MSSPRACGFRFVPSDLPDPHLVERLRDEEGVLGLEVGIAGAPHHQVAPQQSALRLQRAAGVEARHEAVVGAELLESPPRRRDLDDRCGVDGNVGLLRVQHATVERLDVPHHRRRLHGTARARPGLLGGGLDRDGEHAEEDGGKNDATSRQVGSIEKGSGRPVRS